MRTVGKIVAMAALGVTTVAVADPVCDAADLIHRWSFNGNLSDSVGGLTATAVGKTAYDDATNPTAIRLNGDGHDTAYVNLGTGIVPAEGGPITIEIWATQHSEKNWARILDFGPDTQNYLLMSWTQGTSLTTDAVEVKAGNSTVLRADNQLQPYELWVPYHISLTLVQNEDGKATLSWAKRDVATGAVLKSGSGTTSAAWNIANIANWTYCCIGRSQYTGDSDAMASYDEVRIWKTALTAEQLTWSAKLGPDVLPTSETSANCTMTLTCENGSVSVNGATAVGGGSVAVPRSPDATLTAVPLEGYTFVRWTGDTDRIVSGSDRSAEIIVNSARDFALTAEFESADNVVYARYENGDFAYLTPGKGVGNAPQGGMNDGITILFSSDAEYQQLRTVADEVAKAKGLELGGNVKLTGYTDWTALDYSLAGYTIDLNGKTLVTSTLDGGSELVMVNNNFEADVIADGAFVAMTPQGWKTSGTVRLLKNNRDYGDSQYGKSTWCHVPNGAYIEQQFKVMVPGSFQIKFNASCQNSTDYTISDGYALLDGVEKWSQNTVGYGISEKSFTVALDAGVHTLRLGGRNCGAILFDNVSVTRTSFPPSVIQNGNFEADKIEANKKNAMTPQRWTKSGGAYLVNNLDDGGYENRNGSNWMYIQNGHYIQQQFTTARGGECTLSFNASSHTTSGGWRPSKIYVEIDGVSVFSEDRIYKASKSKVVSVGAGTHTLKIGCNSSEAILVDNVTLVQNSYFSEVKSSEAVCDVVVNGDFQADTIPENQQVQKTPQGWTGSGRVYLVKNWSSGGYDTSNGSNWLYLRTGGSVQQQFTTAIGGECTLSFDASSDGEPGGRWSPSDCWVKIDGVQVFQEDRIFKASRSVKVSLAAGLHTLQVGCSNGWGVNVDNVSLKCPCPSGLVVDVPEGKTAVNDSVLISGTTLRLVKSGAGTFVANKANPTYAGGTLVSGGQLTVGNNTALGAASEVTVDAGATLEVNGKGDLYNYSFVLNGGTLQNTGADLTEGTAQIANLRLTAPSTFKPTSSFGLVGSSYAATRLDLAGHTLTVPIGSGKSFYLFNTTVTAGTLDVSGGGWLVADKTAVNASAATLLVNSALDIRVPFSVGSYEALYAGNSNAGDQTLAVTGTFKPHSSAYHGVTLADGATIDMTACPNILMTPGLFTSGANEIIFPTAGDDTTSTVAVELHGRTATSSKIIGWNAQPANVNFVPTEATLADHVEFSARASGLYVPRNTIILIR